MDRGRTIALKTGRALGSVLMVVILVFLALRMVPGDPAILILGEQARPADIERFEKATHLDKALPQQLQAYLGDIADGSLGKPYQARFDTPTVSSLLSDRLPYTLELAIVAILLAILIAVPAGIIAALRPNGLMDRAVLGFSLVGVAVPTFWLGPMLIYIFTVSMDILPGPAEPITGPAHLLLPALTLAFGLSGKLVRFVRTGVLEVLSEEYVLVARSKGLHGPQFLLKHVLPGALIPVVTLIGVQLAALLGGTIVVEQVFARPGIGRLLMDAIYVRDYNVVQGCVLTIAVGYVVVHLFVDLIYTWIDPRVKAEA
ncbi:MAG: glutathione ABC transporter permease GsiC [Myxococcales bacterium]|nr:glutathione ABC transporter permease GsiC [Myxococcales bacterium]|tara:strand:- start:365 stop:1309 length:945 start_codon:yes stop_codon:yes gene_type:complete